MLPCVALAVVALGAGPHPLVGTWEGRERAGNNQFHQVTARFLPNERYALRWRVADVTTESAGTWELEEGRLQMRPDGAAPVAYAVERTGTTLLLRGGDLAARHLARLRLEKQAGSERAAVEEANASAETRARDNRAWEARFPVGPLVPGTAAVVAGAPPDPSPGRVFPGAAVFTRGAIFQRWNTARTWTLSNRVAPNGGYSGTNLYFHANGRVLLHSVQFTDGAAPDAPATVDERRSWGRYRVHPEGRLEVELDDGARHALQLLDGRRAVRFGADVFTNREWERHALE